MESLCLIMARLLWLMNPKLAWERLPTSLLIPAYIEEYIAEGLSYAACPDYACEKLGAFLQQVPPAHANLEALRKTM